MEFDFSGRHFLIVEDDEISREYLYESLKLQGGEVTFVSSGEQAVQVLNENSKVDLILMDICLPGMDGMETTAMLLDKRPDIPVIAQTAYVTEGQQQRILASGFSAYIEKPVKADKLYSIITDLLGN